MREALKKRRKKYRYSQEELAEKAGIARTTYNRYEQDETIPVPSNVIFSIADSLEIQDLQTLKELFCR